MTKMVFYTADVPDGQVVDWPVVPRRGELIQIIHSTGEFTLTVDEVLYMANPKGEFEGIAVWLSQGERP